MVSTGRVLLVCKEVEKSVPFGVQLRHLLALVHVNVKEYPFVRGNNGKEVGQSNFEQTLRHRHPSLALSYRNRECSFLVLVRFFCCHFTAALLPLTCSRNCHYTIAALLFANCTELQLSN